MNDEEYAKKNEEFEKELKPFLTDEFLSTLIKAAKTCGWNVDHIETMEFVIECFDMAGKKSPDHDVLSPFMDEFD